MGSDTRTSTLSASGRATSSTFCFNTMTLSDSPFAAMSSDARSATSLASTAYTFLAPALAAK